MAQSTHFLHEESTRKIVHWSPESYSYLQSRLESPTEIFASDMATKTVQQHEICRLLRLDAVMLYNDIKACFNRGVIAFSSICCIGEGMPTEIAALHAQTLAQINYLVKIKHGESSIANGHMLPFPFLGSRQGAAASMTWWGLISNIIIKPYNKIAISDANAAPISKH